jgi:hypothetical protein
MDPREPTIAALHRLHAAVAERDRTIAELRHQLETSDTRERVLRAARDVALKLAANASPYPMRRAPGDEGNGLQAPVVDGLTVGQPADHDYQDEGDDD